MKKSLILATCGVLLAAFGICGWPEAKSDKNAAPRFDPIVARDIEIQAGKTKELEKQLSEALVRIDKLDKQMDHVIQDVARRVEKSALKYEIEQAGNPSGYDYRFSGTAANTESPDNFHGPFQPPTGAYLDQDTDENEPIDFGEE